MNKKLTQDFYMEGIEKLNKEDYYVSNSGIAKYGHELRDLARFDYEKAGDIGYSKSYDLIKKYY